MLLKAKHLNFLILVLFLLKPFRLFAGQNLPSRASSKQETLPPSKLDRLTLALVNRLPTEAEREFVHGQGPRGAFELANELVNSREFFERLSLYMQLQLEQTPAWLWEAKSKKQGLFRASGLNPTLRNKVVWYVKPAGDPNRHTCSGFWTLLGDNQAPRMCSCEELVDALPAWDPSSAMRVCPIVKSDDHCGSALEHCVPADARMQPENPDLGEDAYSGGGRAITRLLKDISLAQGRSLAAAVLTHRKWSELTIADAYAVQSRSSVELLRKWIELTDSQPLKHIFHALNLGEESQPLRAITLHKQESKTQRYNRPLADSPAEELLLFSGIHPRISFRPFRATSLNEQVWQWNTQLLLTCQRPHLAPQSFAVPLPHPKIAKEGSYFCSGCHISLEGILQNNRGTLSSGVTVSVPLLPPTDASALRLCATDHALQFLLGYRPTGEFAAPYRRLGMQSYQLNAESLSAVIRDLSLELAKGAPE